MHRYGCLWVLLLVCVMPFAKAQERPTEQSAEATLAGFFDALSTENFPRADMREWVTGDFLIYEMGQTFSWPEFQQFLEAADYDTWVSTHWQFSDLRVSLSESAAHISYVNTGEFVYPDPEQPGKNVRELNVWLESAYLVLDDGKLKIKFLQSDNVSRVVEPLL